MLETRSLCHGRDSPYQLGFLQSTKYRWLHPVWGVAKRPRALIAMLSNVDVAAKDIIQLDSICETDQSVPRRLDHRSVQIALVPANVAVWLADQV